MLSTKRHVFNKRGTSSIKGARPSAKEACLQQKGASLSEHFQSLLWQLVAERDSFPGLLPNKEFYTDKTIFLFLQNSIYDPSEIGNDIQNKILIQLMKAK